VAPLYLKRKNGSLKVGRQRCELQQARKSVFAARVRRVWGMSSGVTSSELRSQVSTKTKAAEQMLALADPARCQQGQPPEARRAFGSRLLP